MLTRSALRHAEKQFKVGVIGASGAVGSRFLNLLSNHPWFDVVAMAGAPNEVGHCYRDISDKIYNFLDPRGIPDNLADQRIIHADPAAFKDRGVNLVFSAVPPEVAAKEEQGFADAGFPVFTNVVYNRMKPKIPLLQPYINSDHIELVRQQESFQKTGSGFIATNPNCSTIMMTVGLKPILDSMGLEACMATTLQAISGSGYPGLPMADMWDNVVPHIGGEEEKMETEAAKILGKLTDDGIQFSEVKVSASCNRVPVSDGHLVNVSVKVKDTMGLDQEALCAKAVEAFENFQASPAVQALPSCPEKPVQYFRRDDRPQHRLDRMYSGGMGVSVGRVRPCKILDFKFMVLGHNTIIGAAGGSILNAELFIEKGLIKSSVSGGEQVQVPQQQAASMKA